MSQINSLLVVLVVVCTSLAFEVSIQGYYQGNQNNGNHYGQERNGNNGNLYGQDEGEVDVPVFIERDNGHHYGQERNGNNGNLYGQDEGEVDIPIFMENKNQDNKYKIRGNLDNHQLTDGEEIDLYIFLQKGVGEIDIPIFIERDNGYHYGQERNENSGHHYGQDEDNNFEVAFQKSSLKNKFMKKK